MSNILRTSVSVSALVLGIALSSQVATAADPMEEALGPNWYVSVFGGASFARAHASYSTDHYDIRLKDGFSVGAAIGSHIGNGFRFERELSYLQNDISSATYEEASTPTYPDAEGEFSALFLMGNLWKDFDFGGGFSPYIGGGVGAALLSGEATDGGVVGDFTFDDASLGLAVQLGAGLRVALTDRLALDAGYRYKSVIDASFHSDPDGNEYDGAFSLYSHNVQIGASYALGEGSQIMPAGNGDASSWYVSVFGGGVFPEKTAWEYEGSIYTIGQKTGFTVGAAIGTHLAPGLRTELELSYARTALDSYSTDSGSSDDAGGHLEQGYLLANVWKDINLGMVSPYIGGGVGFGALHFNNADADGGELSNDTGYGLAGQFGVGARMAVSDNLSVDLGYRFKSIVDTLIIGGGDWTYNYDVATHNHIVQLAVNYGIGEGSDVAAAPETLDSRYVSLFGGGVLPLDTHFNYTGENYMVDFKTGFTVGAAVGANLTPELRGEVELAFQTYDVDDVETNGGETSGDGQVDSYFLMANLWRDFELGGFHPYVGGGVGVALMDVNIDFDSDENVDDSTLALAAQVGSGVRFPITDALTLDVGYRFKAAVGVLTEGVDGDDHTAASYYSHIGQAGVSWTF